jgi:glycosyltransferase involved in cell wall biosynthesis
MKHPRDWYAARKRQRVESTGSQVPSAPADHTIPSRTPFWKRAIFSLLWLPDDRQGFIIPAVRAARAHLRGPAAILYTTAPPFSTLLAGWWLKKRTGVRWIADFRDPWTTNPWKPGHVRTAATDGIERFMERRVLGAADLVVAASEGIERVLRTKVTAPEKRLMVIRNGIDRLLPVESLPAGPPRPLRIVHVGSFYHGRDPGPFLRGLAAARKQYGYTREEIQVHLVGQSRWFAGQSVEAAVKSLGLSDMVEFHDWVPHQEAQAIILSAGALLLLAQDQPDQVPNKLYEYLGTRRVILAYVDAGGESADMLRQVGGHFLFTDSDETQVVKAISILAGGKVSPQGESGPLLASWTTQAQMDKLAERIGGL